MALEWVKALGERQFVGTGSRHLTVFELQRQLAEGTEEDPEALSAQLLRYLDDLAAPENRLIMHLQESIEQHAIAVRVQPPSGVSMEIDDAAS